MKTAQCVELSSVVKGTASAAVEHVGKVFAVNGEIATERKIVRRAVKRHDGFACFLPADTLGEEDLRGGAEEIGNLLESGEQGREKVWLDHHVVVQEADMGKPCSGNSSIDGASEGERFGVDLYNDAWILGSKPGDGIVFCPVIDDDDLAWPGLHLGDDLRQQTRQKFSPAAGRNYNRDAWGNPGSEQWRLGCPFEQGGEQAGSQRDVRGHGQINASMGGARAPR